MKICPFSYLCDMATTGQGLWLYTQNIIDKDYSDWISTAKANRLFQAALYNVIEQKLASMDSQKIYDELNSLLVTNFSAAVTSNTITKSTAFVAPNEYMRLMTMKVRMSDPYIQGLTISAINTSTMTVTFNKKVPFANGTLINTNGTLTSAGANSLFYVKKLADKKFRLYTDSGLYNQAVYQAGALGPWQISLVHEEYCVPYISDKKINKLGDPKGYEPMYEDAVGVIKIYPATSTCLSTSVDFIRKPVVFIDVTNNAIDLELTYPIKFLYAIANEFSNIFAASTRDQELYRSSENEIVQNP